MSNMIADLVGSIPGGPSEFNMPLSQDISLAKNFFMVTNGGTTQAGANSEEIVLLREMVSLQKEQIDTLKAKDTSQTVNVNVDSQGIIQEAGKYVSEKSRRGTLDVRTH